MRSASTLTFERKRGKDDYAAEQERGGSCTRANMSRAHTLSSSRENPSREQVFFGDKLGIQEQPAKMSRPNTANRGVFTRICKRPGHVARTHPLIKYCSHLTRQDATCRKGASMLESEQGRGRSHACRRVCGMEGCVCVRARVTPPLSCSDTPFCANMPRPNTANTSRAHTLPSPREYPSRKQVFSGDKLGIH